MLKSFPWPGSPRHPNPGDWCFCGSPRHSAFVAQDAQDKWVLQKVVWRRRCCLTKLPERLKQQSTRLPVNVAWLWLSCPCLSPGGLLVGVLQSSDLNFYIEPSRVPNVELIWIRKLQWFESSKYKRKSLNLWGSTELSEALRQSHRWPVRVPTRLWKEVFNGFETACIHQNSIEFVQIRNRFST